MSRDFENHNGWQPHTAFNTCGLFFRGPAESLFFPDFDVDDFVMLRSISPTCLLFAKHLGFGSEVGRISRSISAHLVACIRLRSLGALLPYPDPAHRERSTTDSKGFFLV
jgi:hypothetical protein